MQIANPESRNPKDVSKMFARVAPSYDKINRAMCFGMDVRWRKILAKAALKCAKNGEILDLACGSGDVAMSVLNLSPEQKITCADFCPEMLAIAKSKILNARGPRNVKFEIADAANLQFENEKFSAVTIAFGFRNFKEREICLNEISRVLKPNGGLFILEVARAPKCVEWAQNIFMEQVAPRIASRLGGNKSDYEYLAKTTRAFPKKRELNKLIESRGFKNVKTKSFAFGCVALTKAQKI